MKYYSTKQVAEKLGISIAKLRQVAGDQKLSLWTNEDIEQISLKLKANMPKSSKNQTVYK
ncbi:hypothetical protein ACFL02_07855 [Planctomycetota bacterium]